MRRWQISPLIGQNGRKMQKDAQAITGVEGGRGGGGYKGGEGGRNMGFAKKIGNG